MSVQAQKAARSGQPTLSDERLKAAYSAAAAGSPEHASFCAAIDQEHRPYFEGALRRHLQGGFRAFGHWAGHAARSSVAAGMPLVASANCTPSE